MNAVPGLYFEEFTVGQRFERGAPHGHRDRQPALQRAHHESGRPAPDAEYARTTPFGERIVNSVFTLGLP
jgi:acyl dehydratase